MALYLGSKKRKIISNNIKLRAIVPIIIATVTECIKLKSLDNYILQDSQGLYLTVKKGE